MIIFLIGFMGCGKSTIGKELARRTGFRFVDMDRRLEEEFGKTVSEIFAEDGEETFRRKESDFLEGLLNVDGDYIIATGGGTPCHGSNMALMSRAGMTIYLKSSPSRLAFRLRKGKARRPLLAETSEERMESRIAEILYSREEFYGSASMIIDCDGVSDSYICGHVLNFIGHHAKY